MRTIDTDQGRTEIDATSAAEEADVALAAHLARNKDHPLVRGLGSLSEIGDQPPLLALSGAVLAYGVLANNQRAAQAGARMLGSLVLATLIKTGLKHLVARTRPNVLLEEGRYEVEPFGPDKGEWHSFPSGHTAGSVAVARAVGRVYPQARAGAYAGAAAIALIQIPRGAHYPADVAAGAAVGIVAETAVNAVADYLHELTREPEDELPGRTWSP
jgi:membrane-associated phospholipid phosphatase